MKDLRLDKEEVVLDQYTSKNSLFIITRLNVIEYSFKYKRTKIYVVNDLETPELKYQEIKSSYIKDDSLKICVGLPDNILLPCGFDEEIFTIREMKKNDPESVILKLYMGKFTDIKITRMGGDI